MTKQSDENDVRDKQDIDDSDGNSGEGDRNGVIPIPSTTSAIEDAGMTTVQDGKGSSSVVGSAKNLSSKIKQTLKMGSGGDSAGDASLLQKQNDNSRILQLLSNTTLSPSPTVVKASTPVANNLRMMTLKPSDDDVNSRKYSTEVQKHPQQEVTDSKHTKQKVFLSSNTNDNSNSDEVTGGDDGGNDYDDEVPTLSRDRDRISCFIVYQLWIVVRVVFLVLVCRYFYYLQCTGLVRRMRHHPKAKISNTAMRGVINITIDGRTDF